MKNFPKRINIGCGQTPIHGWHNFDNSFSLKLSKYNFLIRILNFIGLLNQSQKNMITFAKTSNIVWADAAKGIPLSDNSVEVLYSSHMLEHLSGSEARSFLQEAYRLLEPQGIIRITVPDFKKLVDSYIETGDANTFIQRSMLTRQKPISFRDKLQYQIVGDRHHQWMYDGFSLSQLLIEIGFVNPQILEPGSSTINEPGALDLFEHAATSVSVEAHKPL